MIGVAGICSGASGYDQVDGFMLGCRQDMIGSTGICSVAREI